jgi:hypothetical protein
LEENTMKKKVLFLISTLLIFGLAIVAYSVTKTSTKSNAETSCCQMKDCCQGGVCKMGGDCCKDKDNCPMKSQKSAGEMKDCPMHKKDSSKETSGIDTSKVMVVADGGDCCQGGDCCKGGGSCCHKKN